MSNKYETVFDNKYFSQIRLCYGVLVNIYKSEFGKDIGWWHIKNKRKDLERIDDKFYKTRVDIEVQDNKIYPKGTLLFKYNTSGYYIVGDTLIKDKWHWELKTTGECFSGNTEEFRDMVSLILDIINEINE